MPKHFGKPGQEHCRKASRLDPYDILFSLKIFFCGGNSLSGKLGKTEKTKRGAGILKKYPKGPKTAFGRIL